MARSSPSVSVSSARGEKRVGLEFRGLGQLPDSSIGRGRQIVDVDISADGKQQPFAVVREVVADDALELSDAQPLATGLLLVRELQLSRGQFRGIHQEPSPAGRRVERPQVELELIGLLPLEVGHTCAVGRQPQRPRRRTRQRRIVEHALERELRGRHGQCEQKKQSDRLHRALPG